MIMPFGAIHVAASMMSDDDEEICTNEATYKDAKFICSKCGCERLITRRGELKWCPLCGRKIVEEKE